MGLFPGQPVRATKAIRAKNVEAQVAKNLRMAWLLDGGDPGILTREIRIAYCPFARSWAA